MSCRHTRIFDRLFEVARADKEPFGNSMCFDSDSNERVVFNLPQLTAIASFELFCMINARDG